MKFSELVIKYKHRLITDLGEDEFDKYRRTGRKTLDVFDLVTKYEEEEEIQKLKETTKDIKDVHSGYFDSSGPISPIEQTAPIEQDEPQKIEPKKPIVETKIHPFKSKSKKRKHR